MLSMAFFSQENVWSIAGLYAIYLFSLGLYRLYFSPLSKIPGPRLAALTYWVDFYYDAFKGGQYVWKIAEWHKMYGPIIRITPSEVHVNDPDFYDVVYVGSKRKTQKDPLSYRGFGPLTSGWLTTDHDLHRVRRASVSPSFSKASILQIESLVQSLVNKMISRLKGFQGTGDPVVMTHVCTSVAADIICEFTFSSSYNLLETPDFAPHWYQIVRGNSWCSQLFKHLPYLEPIVRITPPWLVKKIHPSLGGVAGTQGLGWVKVQEVKNDLKGIQKMERRTILHEILTNNHLSEADKDDSRVAAEVAAILGGGSATIEHTLKTLFYHVVANPDIHEKLQQELSSVFGDENVQPSWTQLEKLPYLGAVITETLRWGYGISHRLPRISPELDLVYKEHTIPAGTTTSMTSVYMHNDETQFPSPRTFSPDRWIGPEAAQRRKYLVPFSRGTRSCVGINLAYCELYIATAALFAPGRFRFELYQTGWDDVEIACDYFAPFPRAESKGIRVLIH